MTRTTKKLIIALTAVGLPVVLHASPGPETPHLSFEELDYRAQGGIKIGYSINTGDLVAIQTDGNTVTDIGLATFDKAGSIIFAQAGLVVNKDALELVVADQSVVLVDASGEMLTVDPTVMAAQLADKGHGVTKQLSAIKIGEMLQFKDTINGCTTVDLTTMDIAGKIYGLFHATDTTFVAPVLESGDIWVVMGQLAIAEEDVVVEYVEVTALAAYGIGPSSGTEATRSERPPVDQPHVDMDVVAA